MSNIPVTRAASLKPKPQDEGALGFGRLFTDHMFLQDYSGEKGWHNARIVPYGPIPLDPATTCLHYGQLIFEGMKAYRTAKDEIVLFRPDENIKRLNNSGERMCIPPMEVDAAVDAISQLLRIERDWVPSAPGTSLYVRPFIISTDAFLGVHPSDTYLFIIILSPVGPYYPGGLAPVRIYVETKYVRSVRGGTGYAKFAGNYAASLRSQVDAEEQNYSQVLWLDGVERRNIEEVGAMNVFFVLDDEVVTPALNGSILPGITRKSVIEVLRSWNVPVSERVLAIDELMQANREGRLREAFGTGTAAVISPIGELKWKDEVIEIGGGKIGELSQRLYDELTGIQTCQREDKFGWVYHVC